MTQKIGTSGRKKYSRRAGRGALFLVALMMASAGALRLGNGIGAAMARTDTNAAEHFETSGASLNCPKPPLAVTEALLAREEQVSARESAVADRIAALALANQVIEVRMAKLAETEAKLSETLARADGAAEADLTRLTEMYQTMKPKDAAALFSAMAPEFAAGFFGRMRPDAAAAILSGMTPDAAYSVSVLLAGRNANVPKQ